MKFNTPLPQPLPKECQKAAKIFKSFVDSGNSGLDGVIPRNILENARGFAIFTIFKAGFLFSARAGSGIVIAKLDDGTWSAPSAIGTAGLGVGGQAGAEMTDFLIVLNSRSAVRSFMAAGSFTLGGNVSIAVGPLGRNGEAIGSVNSSGKLAAMYSYSKTRGLFGGVSVEGSVIVERQDANAQAYRSDVTAKMLLSGAVSPPEWASPLIQTLEACTGLPGNHRWVQEFNSQHPENSYIFNGMESPRGENAAYASHRLKKERPSFFSKSTSGSYFDSQDRSRNSTPDLYRSGNSESISTDYHDPSLDEPWQRGERASNDKPTTAFFETKFESDFVSDEELKKHPRLKLSPTSKSLKLPEERGSGHLNDWQPGSPFNSLPPFDPAPSNLTESLPDAFSHRRSVSAYTPSPYESRRGSSSYNPFSSSSTASGQLSALSGRESVDYIEDLEGKGPERTSFSSIPKIKPKVDLTKSLPKGGLARAIALYDFRAVEPGDLSFNKGDVIIVKQMSDSTDSWWTGKINDREGVFPANFVEVV